MFLIVYTYSEQYQEYKRTSIEKKILKTKKNVKILKTKLHNVFTRDDSHKN